MGVLFRSGIYITLSSLLLLAICYFKNDFIIPIQLGIIGFSITSEFVHFLIILGYLKSIFLFLIMLIVISAAVISQVENLPFGEALYFSFITGLTIGYGDIVVKTPFARLIAVLLGLIGMIASGIMVAVSIRAVEKSLIELGILQQS